MHLFSARSGPEKWLRRWQRGGLIAALVAVLVAIPALATATDVFTDVPTASPFHEAISFLHNSGIAPEDCDPRTGGKQFCGTLFTNRQRQAQWLWRAFGHDPSTPGAKLANGSVADSHLAEGYWKRNGNAGTTAGTHFLGTTDNQALELKVNGARALRIEPAVENPPITERGPNIVGGHRLNWVMSGASGATIGGGGGGNNLLTTANRVTDDWGTVAGGSNNQAGDNAGDTFSERFATVGGGASNRASKFADTVAGGNNNTARGGESAVGGGFNNTASGTESTVVGGELNVASGYASTVAGGSTNTAAGQASFAAGLSAKANHDGAFVWSDNNVGPLPAFSFVSTANNQFSARATGGVRFVVAIDGGGAPTWTCSVINGGSWACSSDRALKENIVAVDPRDVLARLQDVPVYRWNAKDDASAIPHMGPMAQDFYTAFGLGGDDKSIATIDLDGVALAAIQGLHEVVQEKDAELSLLKARVEALEEGAGPSPAARATGQQTAGLFGLQVAWLIAGAVFGAGLVLAVRRH